MTGGDLDAIEEFAAEAIIVGLQTPNRVIRTLAQKYPDASGLSFAFALTCVAAGLEAEARANRRINRPNAAGVYRAVALLTADLFELQVTLGQPATGTDLLFHWMKTGDPSFS